MSVMNIFFLFNFVNHLSFILQEGGEVVSNWSIDTKIGDNWTAFKCGKGFQISIPERNSFCAT